jgi:hypothetical protein
VDELQTFPLLNVSSAILTALDERVYLRTVLCQKRSLVFGNAFDGVRETRNY